MEEPTTLSTILSNSRAHLRVIVLTFTCALVLELGAALTKVAQGFFWTSETKVPLPLVDATVDTLALILVRAGVLSAMVGCAHVGVMASGPTRSHWLVAAGVIAAIGLFLLS